MGASTCCQMLREKWEREEFLLEVLQWKLSRVQTLQNDIRLILSHTLRIIEGEFLKRFKLIVYNLILILLLTDLVFPIME